MAPNSFSYAASSRELLTWRPTKIMNMRDLSKDDDFLSHLLVEKLGTGSVPLLVHKMDSSRRLPKVSANDLLEIVRRMVISKNPSQHSIRTAVDELLCLAPIRYYLQNYTQKQINAFATHASRYFELYHPSGSIEISHTSRYSHRTGKSELCILATRTLAPGAVITELKGSMANLTDEEDRELKRTDLRNSDIRRDFSVIHSKSMKKNHLFLGPARFVNHDCNNNCELFREGKYITFRVLRPISIGEEITAHYGDGYFGRKNRHCLCETCEKKGKGAYAPDHTDDDIPSDSSSSDSDDSDFESEGPSSGPDNDVANRQVNLDERRTRRGVYAIVSKEEDLSDESEDEDENNVPLAGASDIPSPGEVEMVAEGDAASDLTSLPSSQASNSNSAGPSRLSSAVSELTPISRSTSTFSSLSSAPSLASKRTPYPSIIATRRQKAEATARLASTPSTMGDGESSASASQRVTRSSASLSPSKDKGKQKERSVTRSTSTPTPKKSDHADADPRTLRTRQPTNVNTSTSAKEASSKPEIPRGPDGKPLPICATCRNILPVISVDHQIVWGLGLEKESKKKKAKQDCPRCMRHMAIYGEPWPRRLPLPGCASTFTATPPLEMTPVESVRKVTHKVLPVLDRKIAAVASKRKHSPEEVEEEEERPAKKRKYSPLPRKHFSSKKGVPNSFPEGQKRKRGRPRIHPIRTEVPRSVPPPASIKKEENDIPLHPQGFKSQGRKLNGRFERKVSSSLSPRKGYDPRSPENSPAGRAQRAAEREKAKQALELLAKRGSDQGEVGPNAKKGRLDDSELPLRRVFPKRSLSSRTGNLFSKPNPMSFAARAWANPLVSDDGSSDDEQGPETPEESQSPPAIIVEPEERERGPSLIVTAPAIPPAYKPSPFSFARRRWSSLSTSPVEESREARPPAKMERIIRDDDSSSISTHLFNEGPQAPSWKSWVEGHDMYLSEEEDLRHDRGINQRPLLLQHTYPSDVVYTQHSFALSIAPPSFITPNFVDPGWESESDS